MENAGKKVDEFGQLASGIADNLFDQMDRVVDQGQNYY